MLKITKILRTIVTEKVNIEQIPIKAGVEISYLNKEEQEIVNQVIEDEQINYKVSDNFDIECYKKIYEKDAYTRIKDKVDNKTIEQNNVEGL